MIKKLPKLRGHGKNRARTVRTNQHDITAVNLIDIEAIFAAGETVSPATLLTKGLVRRVKGRAPAVKILGAGPLTKAFVIKQCAISAVAHKALLAAGGTYHA
jgi:large subunit ribosomal protein L15